MRNPDVCNIEFINKYLGTGHQVKHFKSPRYNKIKNRIFMALLYSFDTKTIDIANYSRCNIRSIQKYIYNGKIPCMVTTKKILFYFNISYDSLFGPHSCVYPMRIKTLQEAQNQKYNEINNTVPIGNKLLFGLLYVYQLRAQNVADEIGINLKTMQRILYTDKDPSDKIKKDLSELFLIPVNVLFNYDYRSRNNIKK